MSVYRWSYRTAALPQPTPEMGVVRPASILEENCAGSWRRRSMQEKTLASMLGHHVSSKFWRKPSR